MAHITWPILDQYSTDGSLGLGAAESWSNGDTASRGIWMDGLNNAISDLQYANKAGADGELLVGDAATQTYKKHVPTGTGGITVTAGAGTLDFSIGAGAIATDRLSAAARAQYLTAIAELDLNAASATVPIGLITRAATIVKAYLVYTVASGAGTGVTVNLGTDTSATAFYTGTSAASQAQYTKTDITGALSATAIAANDFLICSTSGSVATTGGKVLVCLEIETN